MLYRVKIVSRSTLSTDVALINPEDSFNPLIKATVYSVSWVRKHVISDTLRDKNDNKVNMVLNVHRNRKAYLGRGTQLFLKYCHLHNVLDFTYTKYTTQTE